MPREKLSALIDAVKRNLVQGRYQNESSIREAIILPILQELGWDTIDPMIVRREHTILRGRADYCLFAHQSKPDVIIEVKALGLIDGGDRQLFEYAFHEGVPMTLLTDGKEWSFYLPAGQGTYDDRRVYKLDLQERSTHEACEILVRYLAFDRVRLREAIADAKQDYEAAQRARTAVDLIATAWTKLVDELRWSTHRLALREDPTSLRVRPFSRASRSVLGYTSSI